MKTVMIAICSANTTHTIINRDALLCLLSLCICDFNGSMPCDSRGRLTLPIPTEAGFRWYGLIITDVSDPSFVRHYAGHIENGFDSLSDPHRQEHVTVCAQRRTS
jgi:hypothetical protein